MVRILFIAIGLFFLNLSALSAQKEAIAERVVASESPSAYFQGRLERLYKAIEQRDPTQMARYERELVQAMREALQQKLVKDERLANRLQVVFQQFDGFSFTQANPGQQAAHLALLEEFLAILQIND
ncbi:MAG: hypothetical protein ACK5SQ_08255 [Chitinophagales bacterium]|jgi:hypothetical protein